MRENRPCGSEGGEGVSPFRPLSRTISVVPPRGLVWGTACSYAIALFLRGGIAACPAPPRPVLLRNFAHSLIGIAGATALGLGVD